MSDDGVERAGSVKPQVELWVESEEGFARCRTPLAATLSKMDAFIHNLK